MLVDGIAGRGFIDERQRQADILELTKFNNR